MIAALAGWRRFVPAGARRRLRPLRQASRRLAPLTPAEARRPSAPHPDRSELGIRARNADRPRVRRAVRRLARSRHPGTRARDRGARLHERASDAASSGSTSSWRRRGTRRPRSSATSRTHRTSRTTRFDCAIVTQTLQFVYDVPIRPRDAASTSSRRAACCSPPCPASRRSPASRTSSSASGGTTPAARPDASPRRRSAPATSRSRRTGTCSRRRASSTASPRRDLESEELDAHDPLYEVVIGLRAVKR